MPRGVKRPSTPQDFLSLVNKTETCWLWMGGVDKNGYGQFTVNYRNTRAHRYSYSTFVATIPKGALVLHSCDNPPCVNPSHLSLGSHKENARQRAERGRNGNQSGEANHAALLTAKQVESIRTDTRLQRIIAKDYRIAQQTVSDIKRGRRWL